MISVSFVRIIPPPFDVGVIRLYLLTEARKIANEIKVDFLRPARTWSSQPKFSTDVHFPKTGLSIEVFTEDQKYSWISEGTPEHFIYPRFGRRALSFPGVFASKTLPGTLDSRSGARRGRSLVFSEIFNPGITPRKFDDLVHSEWSDTGRIEDRLDQALDRAIIASGYSV